MQFRGSITDSELQRLRECPSRGLCPLKDICAVSDEKSRRLVYPKMLQAKRGDLLWTTHYAEDRVLVFKSGVFLSVGHSSQGREVPFCLYGTGNSVGLSDMFSSEENRSSYHLRTFISGEVCSFSADVIKRELGSFPKNYTQALAVSALMNQCAGAFSLSMIKHQKSMADRVVALLYCLSDFTGRAGAAHEEFRITHEDIAMAVGSDRTTTTRALNKIVANNVIEMRYGNVRLLPETLRDSDKTEEYHTNFIIPEVVNVGKDSLDRDRNIPDYGISYKML